MDTIYDNNEMNVYQHSTTVHHQHEPFRCAIMARCGDYTLTEGKIEFALHVYDSMFCCPILGMTRITKHTTTYIKW